MNSIAASVKVRRKAPVISSSSARATAPTRPATSRICHRENGIMMPLPTKESVCFKWPTPIDVSMSLVKAVFSSLSASKSKNWTSFQIWIRNTFPSKRGWPVFSNLPGLRKSWKLQHFPSARQRHKWISKFKVQVPVWIVRVSELFEDILRTGC